MVCCAVLETMTALWLASSLLAGFAAIFAGLLSRKDRAHLPVAILLTANIAADNVRALLSWLVTSPERYRLLRLYGAANRPPLAGWARVAFHADEALVLGWSVGLAWCAWIVFADHKTKKGAPGFPEAFLVWTGVCVPVMALYPHLSGLPGAPFPLERVYLAATCAGALAVLYSASKRQWFAARATRHLCMLLLVAGEVGAAVTEIAGPFGRWWSAQIGYCIVFAAVIAAQGRQLWILRR